MKGREREKFPLSLNIMSHTPHTSIIELNWVIFPNPAHRKLVHVWNCDTSNEMINVLADPLALNTPMSGLSYSNFISKSYKKFYTVNNLILFTLNLLICQMPR